MIIRDNHATITGVKTQYEMPSGGLEIIAADGRPLFEIRWDKKGESIVISTSVIIKTDAGVLLDSAIAVRPRANNLIAVFRLPYKTGK